MGALGRMPGLCGPGGLLPEKDSLLPQQLTAGPRALQVLPQRDGAGGGAQRHRGRVLCELLEDDGVYWPVMVLLRGIGFWSASSNGALTAASITPSGWSMHGVGAVGSNLKSILQL